MEVAIVSIFLLGGGGGVVAVALLLFPIVCNKATIFSLFQGLSVK